MDVIGIDFFVNALNQIEDWFFDSAAEPNKTIFDVREGYFTPYLLDKLISEKRLGKKVARGIYLYNKDKPLDDVPDFYLNPAYGQPSVANKKTEELIANRLLYSVFSGCLYCIEKGLSTLEEMDLGIKEVLLMKAGPFTMMQQVGRVKLKENFDFLDQHVSTRFQQKSLDFPLS
jgi:3-hydroxyacyl-CoA dehydrogenase